MTSRRGDRRWAARAVVAILMMLAAAMASPAQTFTMLHSFDYTQGVNPPQGLVQGTDGNLYGAAELGGASLACPGGCGTIFKINPGGELSTLHSFDGTDGYEPWGGLIQLSDGSFSGTTYAGGAYGYGTVFKITPGGVLTTLYSFCSLGGCADGQAPYSGMTQGTDGNLYGTTFLGGANGYGTVFKISPGGTLTTLYSFCSQTGCADGSHPQAKLIQGIDGNFYGTTTYGGANSDHGTVFKITPSGTLTTLYSFCSKSGCTDGAYPPSAVVQGMDGNFYGTAQDGGNTNSCPYGCGTVFKMTSGGRLTTLYTFCTQGGDCADGATPYDLVRGTDGNFYGTTATGGGSSGCGSGCGTIFAITPTGAFTTLFSFDYTYGAYPYVGGLVQDTNGTLYGTTGDGGASTNCASGCGTVFSLAVAGLGPFVEAEPPFGKVGSAIRILGTNLMGASSVTFNGTPAVFKVLSPTEIGAVVPAGASSGAVQVVTPSGTLSSNVHFRVLR